MTPANLYLSRILQKYSARSLSAHTTAILQLKANLRKWAHSCFVAIVDSGSRAKGTAISLASDVDYLVSLTSNCNENTGGLKGIFNSLYAYLSSTYHNPRRQNVSVRVTIDGLEVDVTPARQQGGPLVTTHSLYVSKLDSWRQTNIRRHISDISNSGRRNEIKILKIWRELNQLDFPSIYLEYLIVKQVLANKPKGPDYLGTNCWHIIQELAKDEGNPLFTRIVDPANSTNVLSDLLSTTAKNQIIAHAKVAAWQTSWENIVR